MAGDTNKKFEDSIRTLIPIDGLGQGLQDKLIEDAEVRTYRRGEYLFKQGDCDNYSFYLLDGQVEMDSDGQLVKRVVGGTEAARYALAQLQPRQLSAQAKKQSAVLVVDRELLETLVQEGAQASSPEAAGAAGPGEVVVSELAGEDGADWMSRMLQSDLFARIPAANIQRLFAQMEPFEARRGEAIVEQDSPGDFYYIIQRGRCAVSRKASASGREIKLAELGPGDSFGEEALISGATRNASITMMTDGELMRLTKEDFAELIRKPVLRGIGFARAEQLAREGAVWLDLRFPEEYAQAHIEGSINIPLNVLRTQIGKLDRTQRYIVCSGAAGRSAVGAYLLIERGFDVYHLDGGLAESPLGPKLSAARAQAAPAASAKDAEEATAAPTTTPQPSPAEQPASAVPVQPGDDLDAELRASALKTGVADADLKLQDALRLKSEAHAAREAAERAAQERIRAERAKLEAQARGAAEALRTAERLKREADATRQQARQEAARTQEDEERVSRQLEEARRLKAEAEAAREQAEQELETRLQDEREKLAAQAMQASAALEEARRLKQELEQARVAAEAEAERRRAEEEARIREMREEAERHLHEEEVRLKAVYAQNAAELEKIQRMKEEAEARLNEERDKLSAEAAEAHRRMAEARRIREEVEEARARAQSEAESRYSEQVELERQLRDEAKSMIAEERRKLEEKFAENQQRLELAQQERKAAEAARRAAAEEAESIIAEYKASHEKLRAEEEMRLQAEREKLEAEARRIESTLAQARQAKAEAEELREQADQHASQVRKSLARADKDEAEAAELRLRAEMEALDRRVSQADQNLEAASKAQDVAQAAQAANRKQMERARAAADELPDALQEELNEWVRAQEAFETSDTQRELNQRQEAALQRIKARADAARREAKKTTENLFADVAAFLESDED